MNLTYLRMLIHYFYTVTFMPAKNSELPAVKQGIPVLLIFAPTIQCICKIEIRLRCRIILFHFCLTLACQGRVGIKIPPIKITEYD